MNVPHGTARTEHATCKLIARPAARRATSSIAYIRGRWQQHPMALPSLGPKPNDEGLSEPTATT
eukprot:11280870-Heterocapsa_arctica.AAC.1